MAAGKQWKRLLWLKQPFPDTYTDPSFYKQWEKLKIEHEHLRPHSSYRSVLLDLFQFYHMIINTMLLYIIFAWFYHYKYNPILIAGSISSVSLIVANKRVPWKSTIIIIFAMLTLSPVLKSLSKTTSSDSIWTLSAWFTTFYIISISTLESKILPTNILLSNVTVLSSRLDTSTQVFCFLLICIQINILLPTMEKYFIKNKLKFLHILCVIATHGTVYYFITKLMGVGITIPLGISSLLLLFGIPHYYIHWESYYYKGHPILQQWDAEKPILD
ncbi:Gpi2 [Kluyveromyces lactis]|nr:Gpi2 [Kluyveromyces lactis]